MKHRTAVLIILAALALPALACGQSGTVATPYALELQAAADQAAARETAVAESTRTALEMVAKATSDALALEQQATVQAQNAAATAQAQSAQATQSAWAFQTTATAEVAQVRASATAIAVSATYEAESARTTATQAAQNATATATREAATATSQAILDNAHATAMQATAQHVARKNAVEKVTQPAKAVGGVLFVLAGMALFIWALFQLVPIVRARLGAIRRDERGDPPLMALALAGGGIVLYDPTRAWGSATVVNDNVSHPLLAATVEAQDGTTKRGQFVDWMKGGRPRPPVLRRASQPQIPGPNGKNAEWNVEQPEVQWPSRVPLASLTNGAPSARNLALGVTMLPDGRAEVVRAGIGEMVHVAVGGSTGWGKSVFLRALAFQLAQSVDPVDLVLIDLEGATFAPFSGCGRLLYPIADTERDALAVFAALTDEMNRRRGLYAGYPGVDSLEMYNAEAGEPLVPIVCLVDEATALLDDKSVEGAIRTLVLRARKFGLWCVLGGQDWKASSLDTAIRNQLASRVQFKALSAGQSRVLLQQGGAEALNVPGRALAILPGRDMIELQAPVVDHREIRAATWDGGPRNGMPAPEPTQEERIREMAAQGMSHRQIEQEVFGYAGGSAHAAVAAALDGATTT